MPSITLLLLILVYQTRMLAEAAGVMWLTSGITRGRLHSKAGSRQEVHLLMLTETCRLAKLVTIQ